jgi:hypothetical protein
MPGDVAEAGDLRFLRGEVVDGVVHQVGHREGAVDLGRGHVADGYRDSLAAEPGHHRPGQLDAVHRHTALRQRQPDPAGTDGELQRAAASRQLGEQADRLVDDLRLEHAIGRIVVTRCDWFPEIPVWIVHGLRT